MDRQDLLKEILGGGTFFVFMLRFDKPKQGENMDIITKDIGGFATAEIDVLDGAVVASIKVPFIALLEAAAAKAKLAIPGGVDDVLFDSVIAAVKAEFGKK
jgi:hypothetical protein